jgi:hypothetical protein
MVDAAAERSAGDCGGPRRMARDAARVNVTDPMTRHVHGRTLAERGDGPGLVAPLLGIRRARRYLVPAIRVPGPTCARPAEQPNRTSS